MGELDTTIQDMANKYETNEPLVAGYSNSALPELTETDDFDPAWRRQAWLQLGAELQLSRFLSPSAIANRIVGRSLVNDKELSFAYLKRKDDFEALFSQVLSGKRVCPRSVVNLILDDLYTEMSSSLVGRSWTETELKVRIILGEKLDSCESCRAPSGDTAFLVSVLRQAESIEGAIPVGVFRTAFGSRILVQIISLLLTHQEPRVQLKRVVFGLPDKASIDLWRRMVDQIITRKGSTSKQTEQGYEVWEKIHVFADPTTESMNTFVCDGPEGIQGFFVDSALDSKLFTFLPRSEQSTLVWLRQFRELKGYSSL